jgi:hypothetical protein
MISIRDGTSFMAGSACRCACAIAAREGSTPGRHGAGPDLWLTEGGGRAASHRAFLAELAPRTIRFGSSVSEQANFLC